MKFSLRSRIIALILVSASLFGILISYIVFSQIQETLLQEKKDFLKFCTESVKSDLVEAIGYAELATKNIANQPMIQSYLTNGSFNESEIVDYLHFNKIEDVFVSFSLIDNKGMVRISTEDDFVEQYVGDRDYFFEAAKGFSIMTHIADKDLYYYFSYPILSNDGSINGIVLSKIKSNFIHRAISYGKTSGTIMLVDKNGIVLSSTDNVFDFHSLGYLTDSEKREIERFNRISGIDIGPLPYYSDIKESLSSIDGVELFELFNHEKKDIVAVTKINEHPFFILHQEDLTMMIGGIFKASLFIGLLVFLTALPGTIVLTLIISNFLRPIKELEDASIKISQGDFSLRLDESKGSSEIIELSKSFNRMINSIEYTKSRIESKVGEHTEYLIKQKNTADKQKNAILNILQDIKEEKKKTEMFARDLEKFKLAVDGSSDHIIITDPEGTILYANKGVQRITGYSPEEVIGTKAGHLWQYPMDKEFYQDFWETIKAKKLPFHGEMKNRRKNGEVYDALVTISPVLSNSNEILFFVGIERDITTIKEIDRAKTEFVSLASHQLRTPLSSINWYTEILQTDESDNLNDNQKKFIQEICDANKRMIELVNALLNVSRIEMGTLDVEPKEIDFKEIAESVVKESKILFENKKVILETDYDKDLPLINADPKLVRMIFQNLLSNSAKYTPEKGKVSLRVGFEEKFPEHIMIKVSDTGYGIPEYQKEKIFTKLFRADNAKERDAEGTGLGLYIVKSIVDNVKGKIWFDSEEGKGTTFYVLIPLTGMKRKEGSKELI